VLIAVPSSVQSFFQSWNDYKCNCHPQSPNISWIDLFTSIAISLAILLVIVMTIGWIWTCKIAIKRGKLLKKKGKITLTNIRSKYKMW
jgi:isoprenylcysteine carboxyl methyltransferase (ICMT) family protein YpbQ